MNIVRTKARLWRAAEWIAVSAALGWLFVWATIVARRPAPRRGARWLRPTTDGGAA
jgi:hypothetical protein